jgi:hypothetical protein
MSESRIQDRVATGLQHVSTVTRYLKEINRAVQAGDMEAAIKITKEAEYWAGNVYAAVQFIRAGVEKEGRK